ncbi:MAG: peptidylprolyl isomerase [Xanthomonadaceae bacterium]|nr:peptidylprolyl isomerase [Xanthomonadaceae bacterium]
MNRITLSIALLAAVALTGCDRMEQTAAPTGDVVATVNGQPITQGQLDIYSARRGAQMPPADLINDLISIELLRQAAERAGIHERPEVAGELATQRAAILAQAVVRERLDSHTISDADIATEYERYIAEEIGEEMHARHILVPTVEQARELIAALEAGGDFAELAAEHSQDGSAQQGGDLGWFEPGMMVESFSEAAAALEVGAFTREPVQSQFGWHVIKLEGRRTAEAPPFESVQNEIRSYLQSQMVEAWVNELRGEAEISLQTDEAN